MLGLRLRDVGMGTEAFNGYIARNGILWPCKEKVVFRNKRGKEVGENILVVCEGGNSRSVAMAYILKQKYNKDALSCGYRWNKPETMKMLYEWAEKIFAMDEKVFNAIPDEYKNKAHLTDVGRDRWFGYRDKELQSLCDSHCEKVMGASE